MLLVACERLSISNEKPVFTISSMPSVAQQETKRISDGQSEIQCEETGLSEVEQRAPISEDTEKIKMTFTSEEANSVLENIPAKSNDKNQYKANKDADLNEADLETQGEAPLLTEPLNTAENADLNEADLESQGKGPLLTEPLTITEIVSLITIPPSIYTTPPLERIKIGALLRTDGGALKSIMGVPDFMLQTGQMHLWQYNVGGCIIDFFLRQNQYNYLVTFIEIRAKMLGDTINEQTCESELSQALNS